MRFFFRFYLLFPVDFTTWKTIGSPAPYSSNLSFFLTFSAIILPQYFLPYSSVCFFPSSFPFFLPYFLRFDLVVCLIFMLFLILLFFLVEHNACLKFPGRTNHTSLFTCSAMWINVTLEAENTSLSIWNYPKHRL